MTVIDRDPAEKDEPPAPLTVERFGPQTRVTIRRVDKHNALRRDVLAALADAVTHAPDDPACTHVVVTGAGDDYFAAGGDLVELGAIRSVEDTTEFATTSRAQLDALRACPLPVIGWLNGNALGGGAELAMACDLRVMASTARIGYVQARLAMPSAWGGGPDLVARVGPSRALRMMMRCELLTSDEAMAQGIVDAIVDGGPDGDAARAWFKPIEATPRHVLVALKANVVAARGDASHARAVEQANLIDSWIHPAHWAAVDRVFTSTRKTKR